MRFLKRLFHPLVAFIGVQLAWVLVVVFWIYWFISRHKEIKKLAERYRTDLAGPGSDWIVLVEGLLLLLVILVGIYIIFLYWGRQSRLYRQQRSFVSQTTHELKSPLASIQLHLETIKLRHPQAAQLDRFVDTMLADTRRLSHLISNLLMAARIEHGELPLRREVIDLSTFVTGYMERKREKIPQGGNLVVVTEPGILAAIDREEMEIVLRNLFENALLYSNGSPRLSITLKREGRRHALLSFSDQGTGLDRAELKKIFTMFYRVHRSEENIQGTGLGLYIVKTVIKKHNGTVRAVSAGRNQGSTFLITLPVEK
ncbi:MAG TPA: HAMP domain-containing sensor histidine kinase [Geobacterales bacterium]|nr:HAMP domain-containing sensor histidine kinase [Geobacterales bacterium]